MGARTRNSRLHWAESIGIDIHLFVRDTKLTVGKAAPFTYDGRVRYQSHQGSRPMSIVFGLQSGAD